MWDDGKEVCVGRAFSVTFCVLSIYLSFFLYSCPHLQVTPKKPITTVYGSKRVFRRNVWPFGGLDDKKCLGSKLPKNMILGGLNRHFKPNYRNFRIAISRKVRTQSTQNFKGNFRCTNGLRGWSSITKL